MAQVTEGLISEQRERHARGEHFNLTINEEEQLLHAWFDLRRYQMIARMRQLCAVEPDAMAIAEQYRLGQRVGGKAELWVWYQDRAETYPYNALLNVFTVIMATSKTKANMIFASDISPDCDVGSESAFVKLPQYWPGGDQRG